MLSSFPDCTSKKKDMESESPENYSSVSYLPDTSDLDTEDKEDGPYVPKKMPVVMFSKRRKTTQEKTIVEVNSSSEEDLDSRTRDWVMEQDLAEFAELQEKEKRPKEKKKARKRKAVNCKICGKSQVNIWRHMQRQHGEIKEWKKEIPVKSKRGYIIKICPIAQCMKICDNLKEHLVRSHHFNRYSDECNQLLANAEHLMEKAKTPPKEPKRKERKLWPPKVFIITISSYHS